MDSAIAHQQFERRALKLEAKPALQVVIDHIARINESFDDAKFIRTPTYIRSLGSDRVFELTSYEISNREVFVMCENPGVYPFMVNKTLVDVVLKFELPNSLKSEEYISFIGKVEQILTNGSDKGPNGFLVKIAQMSFDERTRFEEILLSK